MSNRLSGGIYAVAMTDGITEYWAAATLRENAVLKVLKMLPPGRTATITDRRLTSSRIAMLKMHPNSVRKL